uniref:SUEL-type lectin domain-containing protein n=1 Tax=Amphiprion percula TaxID=161767 RepID=A0A3P8U443_AMPPE
MLLPQTLHLDLLHQTIQYPSFHQQFVVKLSLLLRTTPFLPTCLPSLSLSTDEYKSKVVCEEERMRLSCKRGMQIAVYSAMFGRTQQGTLECPLYHRRAPSVECQSSVALKVLTSRCQGKKSCLVRASSRDFGDPCYAGTRKYLSVIYTCGESNTPFAFLPPGGDVR